MSRIVLGLLLALCLGIALLRSAPARILDLLLPSEQLVLQGLEGTLWRGSASRCMLRTDAGLLHLGAVRWSLQPLSLLFFAPRLSLHSVWGSQTFSGEVVLHAAQGVDLYDVEALLPADLLRQFAPVSLSGTLAAQVESLQWRDGLPHSGSGRLVWQHGGWQSPQGPLRLGSYALDFSQAPGAELTGQVITVSGPVEASGTVQLRAREYEIDVLIGSKEPLDAQLEQALSLIAAPGPQGYQVKFDGELQ